MTAVVADTDQGGLHRSLRLALILLAILNAFDLWTTYVALGLGAHEANPLIAWAVHTPLPFVMKASVVGAIIWLARKRPAETVIPKVWFVTGVYFAVVLSNLMVIGRLAS